MTRGCSECEFVDLLFDDYPCSACVQGGGDDDAENKFTSINSCSRCVYNSGDVPPYKLPCLDCSRNPRSHTAGRYDYFKKEKQNCTEFSNYEAKPQRPISGGNYSQLHRVLNDAAEQASTGKGLERHACGEPFEKQQIVEITKRLHGNIAAGPLFQAVKKCYESSRLDKHAAIHELYGAINYIAAAIIVFEDSEDE